MLLLARFSGNHQYSAVFDGRKGIRAQIAAWR